MCPSMSHYSTHAATWAFWLCNTNCNNAVSSLSFHSAITTSSHMLMPCLRPTTVITCGWGAMRERRHQYQPLPARQACCCNCYRCCFDSSLLLPLQWEKRHCRRCCCYCCLQQPSRLLLLPPLPLLLLLVPLASWAAAQRQVCLTHPGRHAAKACQVRLVGPKGRACHCSTLCVREIHACVRETQACQIHTSVRVTLASIAHAQTAAAGGRSIHACHLLCCTTQH